MQAFHRSSIVVISIDKSAYDAVTAALHLGAPFITAIIASVIPTERALFTRTTYGLAGIAAVTKHEGLALGPQ